MSGGPGAVAIEITVLCVLFVVGCIAVLRLLARAYRPPVAATTDEGLREQLLVARADISRQIEIMQTGGHGKGGVDLKPILAGLRAQMAEIDARLSEPDEDEDRPTLH